MRLSVNEVYTTCRRAAAGAGLPEGLAEDAAAATVWLVLAGLDGIEVFRRALENVAAGRAGAVTGAAHDGTYLYTPADEGKLASALFAGPALFDRIAAGMDDPCVGIQLVDEPVLALAGADPAARRAPRPTRFHCRLADGQSGFEARFDEAGCWIHAGDARDIDGPGPGDLFVEWPTGGEPDSPCRLTPAEAERTARRCHEEGVTVSDAVYEPVSARARNMLVADSERSRLAGAGAGLNDND